MQPSGEGQSQLFSSRYANPRFPSPNDYVKHNKMPKLADIVKRKPARPPAIGGGAFVGMRLPAALLKSIDQWAKQNAVSGRSDAMRRLLELGLAGALSARQLSKEAKRKAAEMAAQEIDRLGNQTIPNEESARRKRRLIKGPREFRDVRTDQPKNKS